MKRFVTLLLIALMMGATAFAQGQLESMQVSAKRSLVKGIHPDYRSEFTKDFSRTTVCGTDEIGYAINKINVDGTIEIGAFGAAFNQRAYGQTYEVPTGKSVNVSGISFWGANTNIIPIDVRIDIYNVNSTTKLPLGAPTNSFTYSMDTASAIRPYNFNFPTAVARTAEYCMVVTAVSDSILFLVSNDWTKDDGRGEYLNAWFFASGQWISGNQVGVGNNNDANADWFIEPRVDYSFDASLALSATSGCVQKGTDVEFTAILDPFLQSRFYNQNVLLNTFFNIPDSTAQWDFNGDGNIDAYGTTVTWNYPPSTSNDMVSVTLNATNNGFTTGGNCVDATTEMFPSGGAANSLFKIDDLGERQIRVVAAFKEDAIDSYTWDFGDGTTDATSGDTAIHTYAISDTFTVTLTTLNCGTSDFREEIIFVNPATNVSTGIFSTFEVYPNPVNDVLNLDLNLDRIENVNVKIMDISGRVVSQRDLGATQSVQASFDMNKFEAGIYVVAVQAGEEVSYKKVVLK